MFEKASRLKLRFETPVGLIGAEDLWDLPLTSSRPNRANLNDIAKDISRQLKAQGEEDFVNPKTAVDEGLQLMLEIVKHVIQVKQIEASAANDLRERREKKAKLLELISKKKDQELEGKSLEELTAMVDSL